MAIKHVAKQYDYIGLSTDDKSSITTEGATIYYVDTGEMGVYHDGIWQNKKNLTNPDTSGRISMNSVFGEQLVGQRIPSISAQFMYGIDTRVAKTELSSNGGSITFTDSLLKVNSGTNSNGDGLIESKQALRYVPGHEAYCYFTTVFSTPKVNSRQEAGLYEATNGFWIGYVDEEFGLMRIRGGVEYWTPSSEFDTDIIDGNNEHNFTIDLTKGNIWKLSYGYLGFAVITLEVLCTCGQWFKVHRIKYPNTSAVTHIANTYLPLRARAINTGNTTNISVSIGSVSAGIVDGGGAESTGRRFSASMPSTATGTNTAIAVFRNKSTFNSIQNHVEGRLTRISITTDGAQPVTLQILKGFTITNSPTWADIDTNNSIHEYTTNATVTTTNAYQTVAFELAKSDKYVEDVRYLDINLFAGESALFLANGSNNVKISMNWVELF